MCQAGEAAQLRRYLPAAVAYYGPDRTKAPDGPVTRELLAKPVQKALKDLGEPVPLESLSPNPPKEGVGLAR